MFLIGLEVTGRLNRNDLAYILSYGGQSGQDLKTLPFDKWSRQVCDDLVFSLPVKVIGRGQHSVSVLPRFALVWMRDVEEDTYSP